MARCFLLEGGGDGRERSGECGGFVFAVSSTLSRVAPGRSRAVVESRDDPSATSSNFLFVDLVFAVVHAYS